MYILCRFVFQLPYSPSYKICYGTIGRSTTCCSEGRLYLSYVWCSFFRCVALRYPAEDVAAVVELPSPVLPRRLRPYYLRGNHNNNAALLQKSSGMTGRYRACRLIAFCGAVSRLPRSTLVSVFCSCYGRPSGAYRVGSSAFVRSSEPPPTTKA